MLKLRVAPVWLGLTFALGCNCGHGHLESSNGTPQGSSGINFGNEQVGAVKSLTGQIILTNVGGGSLAITGSKITGTNASEFALQTSLPDSLAPGAAITSTLQFAPSAAGPQQATLEIDTDNGEVEVPLTGTGIEVKLCAQPASLDFGNVQVGGTPAVQPAQIVNCGKSPTTVTFATPSIQGSNASDFTASVQATPLQPGAMLTVSVSYSPAKVGPSSADLPFYACQGCSAQQISLTGVGVDGALSFTPDPVNFGQVAPGMSVVVSLTGTNTGTENITVSALTTQMGDPAFSFVSEPSLPLSLTPGQSFPLTVQYAPTNAAGDKDVLLGVFAVADLAVGPRQGTDPLNGNAPAGPCQLVITPRSVSFGYIGVGKTSTKSVTLQNTGAGTCHVTNVALGSGTDPYFALVPPPATIPINANATATIQVTFTPTTFSPPTLRRGTLTFTSDDPNNTMGSVPLIASIQNTVYTGTWPKWHHDNGNTGLTIADSSGNQGKVAWKVSLGVPVGSSGELATYINSPAVGQDSSTKNDVVYMLGYGTYNINNVYNKNPPGSGKFVAVDGPSGNVLWTTAVTGPENSAQEATPTIVADGSIFLMTGGEQTSYPEFFHISPSGHILWSGVQAVGGTTCACTFDPTGKSTCTTQCGSFKINDGFDTCPGFDDNGTLYLYDDDQPGCDTYSSSTAQPTLKWSTPESDQPAHVESFSAALTSTSESIFSWGGFAVAFGATGTQMWGVTVGTGPMTHGWASGMAKCENDSKGSPAIDGAEVDAVMTFGGFDSTCATIVGGIAGINLATGTQDWVFQFPNGNPPAAPYNTNGYGSALVAYSSPAALTNGGWVIGWLDGVYAFTPPASGQGNAMQLWKYSTGLVLSSPAVSGDGTVFVGSTDGNFYAIDGDTGQLKWKYTVGAAINSSPAIGSDGSVYFAADDGNLYALR
jgi:outer membrane protein assembly factor BamB